MPRPLITGVRHIPDEEQERSMRASMPPTLYKYRTWQNEYHKSSLINSNIWFSSPRELNDLYDIRLAYTFNSEEVLSPIFLQRLREEFPSMGRFVIGTRDFEIALENKYEEIKSDPQKWFLTNQLYVRNSGTYDVIGLFSTTADQLSKLMWAHYGDSHRGFCIGYDPYLIWKARQSFCGIAHYLDEPIPFSFIEPQKSQGFIDLFIKGAEWSYEKEYRFVTFVDDNSRLTQIDRSAITEVIMGRNISSDDQKAIIKCLKEDYTSAVKLFKIKEGYKSELALDSITY
jgi:hypothetical protein